MRNNAAPYAPAKAISSVPIWRAFIETYGLRRAVFLEGLVGPSGSDPPQRGIVSLLSGRRPGSRLSPGVSDKSLPRPKPVAACVCPEDPPRSKPGRSIFFPLSSTAWGSACTCFLVLCLLRSSVTFCDSGEDEVAVFSIFFVAFLLSWRAVLRRGGQQNEGMRTVRVCGLNSLQR